MKTNILDLVEGAYDTTLDGQRWLVQSAERFAGWLPGVVEWGGHVASKNPDGPPIFHHAYATHTEDAAAIFTPIRANLSSEFAEAIFPTGTRCGFFSEHWDAVRETREWNETSLLGARALQAYIRSFGADDMLFLLGSLDHGPGVLLAALVRETTLTDAARTLLVRAAVHVRTGLRLRHKLLEAAAGGVDEPGEAILESDGRLAHATGHAAEGEMRAVLRQAARQIDRARTRAVRRHEGEALELWQGLVQGRWSLIDRHESDGRRYYVAVVNQPDGACFRQLTEMEAQVVTHVVSGEPNGVIAYSLGLAPSTVATHLTRAMRKLGASSRIDLVRIGRALGGRPVTPAAPRHA